MLCLLGFQAQPRLGPLLPTPGTEAANWGTWAAPNQVGMAPNMAGPNMGGPNMGQWSQGNQVNKIILNCTVLILKGNSYCCLTRGAKGLGLKSHQKIRYLHTNIVTHLNTNRA